MTDWRTALAQLEALLDGCTCPVSCLANASALICEVMDRINWAGFYLREGDTLYLGPFQGKPACIRIPMGKGVCGTAAEKDAVTVVPDVHLFPGHIACDSASRSEIVLPFHNGNGEVAGVLDIDSPLTDRFDASDREGLKILTRALEKHLNAL